MKVARPRSISIYLALLAALVALISCLALGCASATPTPTPSKLSGQWEGIIDVAKTKIALRLELREEAGSWKATMGIPEQGLQGYAVESVKVNADALELEVFPSPRTAKMVGSLQPDDTITGQFTQSGFEGTFKLERAKAVVEEKPTFAREEVKVEHDAVSLACTLSYTNTNSPQPAVVLITGSGQQDRDENVFDFKVFQSLATHLTNAGIAVLRCDDRGVGGSKGEVATATTKDFAQDTAASIDYLKTRKEVDVKKIGLIGHSEGALIASMLAAERSDVAFIVLMAGPGVNGEELLAQQLVATLKADGATQEQIGAALARQKKTLSAVRTGQGWDELKAEINQELRTAIAAMTEDQRKSLGDIDAYVKKAVDSQVQAIDTNWLRYFLDYDPATALSKVKMPVLALFGELDTQVPLENKDIVLKALTGNPDITAQVLPKANHLFQKAETGSPTEYAKLEKTFVPGLLESISTWVLQRTK